MKYVIALTCLLALGCAEKQPDPPAIEDANLVFYDLSGEVVAYALLDLPGELPPVGDQWDGDCQLLWFSDGFPADKMAGDTYRGYVRDEWISFDLNPDVADHNIVFHGDFDDNPMDGSWATASIAGDTNQGTFELTRD